MSDSDDEVDAGLDLMAVLDDNGVVWIFHDRPFSPPVEWIEYDAASRLIDFVLEGGQTLNYGIPLDERIGRHLAGMRTVSLVLREGETVVSGEEYPLVIHDRAAG